MVLVFAREALRSDYFRRVVMPADVAAWAFLRRRLYLTENGLLVFYRALFFYGLGRMVAWFLYARFEVKTPWQPVWGGPRYVGGNYLNDGSTLEITIRLVIGGAAFVLFIWLCWLTFVRRLWRRAGVPPGVESGPPQQVVLQ
jgi:hypothetical protein